jgi:hypothetical protein
MPGTKLDAWGQTETGSNCGKDAEGKNPQSIRRKGCIIPSSYYEERGRRRGADVGDGHEEALTDVQNHPSTKNVSFQVVKVASHTDNA